jgi:hypothetical protein
LVKAHPSATLFQRRLPHLPQRSQHFFVVDSVVIVLEHGRRVGNVHRRAMGGRRMGATREATQGVVVVDVDRSEV